ncbi:hypothetical protein EON83_24585 [bacterium]|nr:MAG: hypothetical protein EON83_24585 [bacterium]
MVQRDLHGDEPWPPCDTGDNDDLESNEPDRPVYGQPPIEKRPSPADSTRENVPELAIQFVSRAAGPLALILVLIGVIIFVF